MLTSDSRRIVFQHCGAWRALAQCLRAHSTLQTDRPLNELVEQLLATRVRTSSGWSRQLRSSSDAAAVVNLHAPSATRARPRG
jgi:hypothetical protein